MQSVRMGDIFWNSAMLALSFCIVYAMIWLLEEGFRIYSVPIFINIDGIGFINCMISIIGACAVLVSSTIMCVHLSDEEKYDKKKEEKKGVQSKLDSF